MQWSAARRLPTGFFESSSRLGPDLYWYSMSDALTLQSGTGLANSTLAFKKPPFAPDRNAADAQADVLTQPVTTSIPFLRPSAFA